MKPIVLALFVILGCTEYGVHGGLISENLAKERHDLNLISLVETSLNGEELSRLPLLHSSHVVEKRSAIAEDSKPSDLIKGKGINLFSDIKQDPIQQLADVLGLSPNKVFKPKFAIWKLLDEPSSIGQLFQIVFPGIKSPWNPAVDIISILNPLETPGDIAKELGTALTYVFGFKELPRGQNEINGMTCLVDTLDYLPSPFEEIADDFFEIPTFDFSSVMSFVTPVIEAAKSPSFLDDFNVTTLIESLNLKPMNMLPGQEGERPNIVTNILTELRAEPTINEILDFLPLIDPFKYAYKFYFEPLQLLQTLFKKSSVMCDVESPEYVDIFEVARVTDKDVFDSLFSTKNTLPTDLSSQLYLALMFIKILVDLIKFISVPILFAMVTLVSIKSALSL